jgi:hypothetical protein
MGHVLHFHTEAITVEQEVGTNELWGVKLFDRGDSGGLNRWLLGLRLGLSSRRWDWDILRDCFRLVGFSHYFVI